MQGAAIIINIKLIKMRLGINEVVVATAFTYFLYGLVARPAGGTYISKQQNSFQTVE